MSAPRLLTLAEIEAWVADLCATLKRRGVPFSDPFIDRMAATLRNGAADRRRESLEAIEAEARSIARHMIDQARR